MNSTVINLTSNLNGTVELHLDNSYLDYSGVVEKYTVTVNNPVDPVIITSNVKPIYNTGSYYTIMVYGSNGKGTNASVKITGKISKTLTAVNSVAKFKITQIPGTYKITISSLGISVSKTIPAKHPLNLKSVPVKRFAKKLVLQASFTKFNGKTYKTKTNSKGIAKVTVKKSVLKKLKKGKKITYSATYLKDTVKKTAKVKK